MAICKAALAVRLPRARLEHEELALLHRELDVLHVAVMGFQPGRDARQLGEGLGHRFFHRRAFGTARPRAALGDGLRRADAGHHVFALRVDQKFAVERALAGGGIAGEGDAGGRCARPDCRTPWPER